MDSMIPFYHLGDTSDSTSGLHKDEMEPVLHVESDYILIIASKSVMGKRVAGKVIIGDPEQTQEQNDSFGQFWDDLDLRREYLRSYAMCLQANIQSIEGFDKFSERVGVHPDGELGEVIPNIDDPFEFIEAGDRWALVEFSDWLSGASFKVTAGNCADLSESEFRDEVLQRLIYGFEQLGSYIRGISKK